MAKVPCELVRMIVDERCDEQAIVLGDGAGRELPIGIGIFEASIIDRILKEKRGERPLTHELLAAVIGALGAHLDGVEIDGRRGPVFFAKLVLSRPGDPVRRLDGRPSDAVALALLLGAPISVEETLLAGDAGGTPGPGAAEGGGA